MKAVITVVYQNISAQQALKEEVTAQPAGRTKRTAQIQ